MNHQAWILNPESFNLPITLPTKVCKFMSFKEKFSSREINPSSTLKLKQITKFSTRKVFLAQKAQKRLTYPFRVNWARKASNAASLDASLTAVGEESATDCAAILFSSHSSRGKPLSANWGLVFFLSNRPRSFVGQWSQLPVKNANFGKP